MHYGCVIIYVFLIFAVITGNWWIVGIMLIGGVILALVNKLKK